MFTISKLPRLGLVVVAAVLTTIETWNALAANQTAVLRAPDLNAYCVQKVRRALETAGYDLNATSGIAPVTVALEIGKNAVITNEESFQIIHDKPEQLTIRSGGTNGLIYGALALAEDLRNGVKLDSVAARVQTPHFPFRAIKFNLPWMSYRKGEALQQHQETCRDLKYWEAFLDMMAENRFNTLTLWGLHPYTLMIRPQNYPEACGLSDAELADWQRFWKSLFRMAKERGIETYIVNWNIFVSPEFAKAHNVATYSVDWDYIGEGDTSDLVKKYTRECVTQVLNEYEDLTGLGITHGERMGGMLPEQRQQWIADTFVAGMKAAKRPAKFIHRAPLSAGTGSGGSTSTSTEKMTREALETMELPSPIWVEMKFNWSHSISSPHLRQVHGGPLTDTYWNPPPNNYKMTWMCRNEDVFCLRWGEPDFIRTHIGLNDQSYVGGYFVGSECYIPAKDYFTKPDARINWRYAFERQWLYYKAWGRLLYDPGTKDDVFASEFRRRYGADGEKVYRALVLGSRMPVRLGSFYKASNDFSLYEEGFMVQGAGNDRSTPPLISIEQFIDRPVLDPDYVSIADFVNVQIAKKAVEKGKVTPLSLADDLERDAREILQLVESVKTDQSPVFYEVVDSRAWAYLSLYFSEKLRGGVDFLMFRKTGEKNYQDQSVAHLTKALEHWLKLAELTEPVYREMPLIHIHDYPNPNFHWTREIPAVERDIEVAKNAQPKKP